MSITCVSLTDNRFLVQSYIGQIIFSSTLDTEDKVKQLYGGNRWEDVNRFVLKPPETPDPATAIYIWKRTE